MADEIKLTLSNKEFQELKCMRLSLQDIATELRKMNRKDERYQEIWNEGYLAGIKSMQPQVFPNDSPYRTSTYYEKLKRESEELKRRIDENLNSETPVYERLKKESEELKRRIDENLNSETPVMDTIFGV